MSGEAASLPELALDPLGQVVAHLDGEVLTVESLHLVQGLPLELLGLDPHGHGPACPFQSPGQREKLHSCYEFMLVKVPLNPPSVLNTGRADQSYADDSPRIVSRMTWGCPRFGTRYDRITILYQMKNPRGSGKVMLLKGFVIMSRARH